KRERKMAEKMLEEIRTRLQFLDEVCRDYLTLDRLTSTLSGGESQRIQLATSLGSHLVGALYVLDEPSIGLHPRDTQRLIDILKSLRDLGNTVLSSNTTPIRFRPPATSLISGQARANWVESSCSKEPTSRFCVIQNRSPENT